MKTRSQFINLRDALDEIRAKYNYLITEDENEILSDAYDLADHQYNFMKRIESNISLDDCKTDAKRCKRLIKETEEAIRLVPDEDLECDYIMIMVALHMLNACINESLEALEAE